MIMHYFIASDHAGFALKNALKEKLKEKFAFIDLGPFSSDSVDYPDFAEKLAKKIVEEKGALGILVCGTGIGMSIAANKIKGIRAATIYDEFSAKAAREHNDANIACFGARTIDVENAVKMAEIFLATKFAGAVKDGERHLKRVKKIEAIENRHFK